MSISGQYVDYQPSVRAERLNSGDTGAGSARNGDQINLRPASGYRYRRARVVVDYRAMFASSGGTVTLAAKMQHRSSTSGAGSTYADFSTASSITKTVANAATSTDNIYRNRFFADYNLIGINQYARVVVTPTFTATTTAMALEICAGVILPDVNKLPPST